MRDTSGPAFPAGFEASDNDTMGLTIRDYFAAQALAGLTAHPKCGPVGPGYEETTGFVAREAYALADAMLKERNK